MDAVSDVKGVMPEVRSLNETLIPGTQDSELSDLVRDERSSDLAGAVVRGVETDQLLDAVEELPPRSRYVLARRYGLGHVRAASIAELSEELSLSRKRIIRMQDEAERSLKRRMHNRPTRRAAVERAMEL